MTWRLWRRRPDDSPVVGAAPDFDEASAFVDQARWLIEFHNKRSDAFSTRAVALLGFSGVTLALLSRASVPGNDGLNAFMFVLLIATVALLFTSAYFCLRTVTVTRSSAPGTHDLRNMWASWAGTQRRGSAHGDIAESFLKAKTPDVVNPVDDAIEEANSRADWFRDAVSAMLGALTCLAVLLLLIAGESL